MAKRRRLETPSSADLSRIEEQFRSETSLPIVDAHHHFWRMDNPHPWLTELPRIPFRYGDYEVICKDTERDNFMGAEDAVTLGIVDRVLTSREDLAKAQDD